MPNYNQTLQTNNSSLEEIITKLNNMPDAENTDIEDELITGTITNYTNDRVTKIVDYTFYYHNHLTSVNFPECTYIGYNVFARCISLTSVNFPECAIIGNNAFSRCTSLTSVNLPKAFDIGSGAFYSCTSLTSVNLPICRFLGSGAFYSCTSLTSVNLPECGEINPYTFSCCYNLISVNLPVCIIINEGAFRYCYNLTSLYLLNSSICTLSNSNAFSSTPIAGYTTSTGGVYGSIYVPASLVDAYKVATNWAYFSSRFVGI